MAVFRLLTPRHQLEVVDDDETEASLSALQPAGLAPDVHDGEVRVVVDEHRGFAQPADGVAEGIMGIIAHRSVLFSSVGVAMGVVDAAM